jgi:uncharacterized protein YjbI with pentapeptide repeats
MNTALLIGGLICIVTVLLIATWTLPRKQIRRFVIPSDKDRFDAENEARRTILQVIGGTVALVGLVAGYQSLKTAQTQAEAASLQAKTAADAARLQADIAGKTIDVSRRQAEIAALQAKQQFDQSSAQLKLTAEGQVADRFSRGVLQLSDKEVTTRVSGIYALKLVADDASRYRPLVLDVLSSYIRAHQLPESAGSHGNTELSAIAPDLQVAAGIIGRYFPGERKNLDRATLPVVSMNQADFRSSSLYGADLFKSSAEHGLFADASLMKTNWVFSRLKGADFSRAFLDDSNLSNADISGAVFDHAFMSECNLSNSDMRNATLNSAILHGAILASAKLQNASLRRAVLLEANLIEAELDHADLTGANMEFADFLLASTQGAIVRGADLRGTKRLTQFQIDGMVGDKRTQLPEKLDDLYFEKGGVPVRPSTWK